MPKYTAQQVATIQQVNAELEKLQEVIDRVLFRYDDASPNAMLTELDMNSFRVINGKTPIGNSDLVTKAYVDALISSSGNLVPSATTVTETEGLTSGQLVVTLSTVDPDEAIFYISSPNVDSRRIFEVYDFTITGASEITLTESYPAGTLLLAIQETA